jgi:hypothetical protein
MAEEVLAQAAELELAVKVVWLIQAVMTQLDLAAVAVVRVVALIVQVGQVLKA